MKKDRLWRLKVYYKYEGHCAYCGIPINEEKFQVDHIWPRFLSHFHPELKEDRFENLNPACIKCNIHKGVFRLEDFRREISLQVTRLKKNAQFDKALRYGQIEICEKPIVFYFEKINQ